MKRKTLLILPFLAVGTLTSCGSDNKIELKRQYGAEFLVAITSAQLETKVKDKDNFLLLIDDSSCLSCAAFKPIIESYIKESFALIYSISTAEAKKSEIITFKITPSMFLFKDGKRTKTIEHGSNQAFETKEAFKSFMKKYTVLSSRIGIKEDDLDLFIKEGKEFIVLFSYDLCGDCNAFDDLFLHDYQAKNPKQEFYELELSWYFQERENSSDPIWTDFTAKYQLSKAGSEKFGWGNGVVPTFQYYKNGTLLNAAVAYNDSMEYQKDTDGTIKSAKVTKSYFADAPFIGQVFTATKDKSALTLYKENTLGFYSTKIKDIFNLLY